MKIKVKDLTGDLLWLAVALAQGVAYQQGIPASEDTPDTLPLCREGIWQRWYSGVWSCRYCAGLIVEKPDFEQLVESKGISLTRRPMVADEKNRWFATSDNPDDPITGEHGATPAQAAFRCVVATCLGAEPEIEDWLVAAVRT